MPFKALEKARKTGIILFSESTFNELEMVLLRRKFDKYFSVEERLQIIERFYLDGAFLKVIEGGQHSRDAKDDQFLHLAIQANADCIISGDDDLLVLNPFQGIPILSSVDFLNHFNF